MADDIQDQDAALDPWHYGLDAQETAAVFGPKDTGIGQGQAVKRLDIQIALNKVIAAFPEIDFNGKAKTAAQVKLPGWNNAARGTFDVTMSVVFVRDKAGNLLSRESRYYEIEDAPEKESMSIPSLTVVEKFKNGVRREMTITDGPEGYDRSPKYEFYQERYKRGLTARTIYPTPPKDTPRDFCTYHYDAAGDLSRSDGPALEGRIQGQPVARFMLRGAEMTKDAFYKLPEIRQANSFRSRLSGIFGRFAHHGKDAAIQAEPAAPIPAAKALDGKKPSL